MTPRLATPKRGPGEGLGPGLRAGAPETRGAPLPPHFLLNSLHLVGVTLRREGPDEALRVLEELGGLLRHVVDADHRPVVTLREEVAFAESCVAVERARMGTDVELAVRAGEDAREAPVPSLILQPLVENALRHGLRGREGAGVVEIRAVRSGRTLDVSVLDDGPGLPDGWDVATDAGCGLRAVEALLARRGGPGARLDVRGRRGACGTEARVRLRLA